MGTNRPKILTYDWQYIWKFLLLDNCPKGAKMFTVSLEVAKRLKEAGVELKTEWWWRWTIQGKTELILKNQYCTKEEIPEVSYYPAPTLGELVRELPEGYRIYKETLWICDSKNKLYWKRADTPEDAAALMLIELRRSNQCQS